MQSGMAVDEGFSAAEQSWTVKPAYAAIVISVLRPLGYWVYGLATNI